MTNDDRIAAIERSLHRWKRVAAAVSVCFLVALVAAATQEREREVLETMRTKKLEIVNDKGVVVGSFFASEHGGRLHVGSPVGEDLFSVAADEFGHAVAQLYSKSGTPGNVLHGSTPRESGGAIVLYRGKGGEGLNLYGGNKETDSGLIRVNRGFESNAVIILSSNKDAEGALVLRTSDGVQRTLTATR